MKDISHRIKSHDARTIAAYAVMCFVASSAFAVGCQVTDGFLCVFLGVWSFIGGVAAVLMVVGWASYVFE